MPNALIKVHRTGRVFDIQSLRTIDYDAALRVDRVNADIEEIRAVLVATMEAPEHDINSLVRILGIAKATPAPESKISSDAALILSALEELRLPNGERVRVGDTLYTGKEHDEIGELVSVENAGIIVRQVSGELLRIPPDDDFFATLTMCHSNIVPPAVPTGRCAAAETESLGFVLQHYRQEMKCNM